MTTITLPRATVEQALEALEMCRLNGSQYLYGNERDLVFSAIKALRAALAQQAEPVLQGPVRIKPGSYTLGATWVGGGGGSGGVGAPPQQAEPTWVCPDSPEHRYAKPGHCEDCGKTLVLVQEQGCDRCNHPLYAATRCRVCGRVTEPKEQDEPVQEPMQESALQAVAEKIGDQCAVWYGIGARDVEEVLREAARYGLVRAAQAEPVQEPIGYLWPTGRHPEFRFTQQKRDGVDGTPVYTVPPKAEPVQEPVAWYYERDTDKGLSFAPDRDPYKCWQPLHTAPPQRKPLTDEEIDRVWDQWFGAYGLRGSGGPYTRRGFARAIERAHGINHSKPE